MSLKGLSCCRGISFGVFVFLGLLSLPSQGNAEVMKGKELNPDRIIEQLKKGNLRFSQGKAHTPPYDVPSRHGKPRIAQAATANQGEFAYATILSCSDSRVPLEILFDVGIMELFVVRVAGNVATGNTVLGSIEFGIGHVQTPLLVIMGHTDCGAVSGAVALQEGRPLNSDQKSHLTKLLVPIEEVVARVQKKYPNKHGKDLIELSVRENVLATIEEIFKQNAVVRRKVASGQVKVVGAIYHMEDGHVEFMPEEVSRSIFAKTSKSKNTGGDGY